VDYWGIVKQAVRVTRSHPGLWGFGAVAAVSALLSTLVFGVIGLVSALAGMLAQFMVMGTVEGSVLSAGDIADFVASAQQLAQPYLPVIIAGAVMLGLVWLTVVIFDVAATGGVIIQTNAALDGAHVSFREGMSQGFAAWGRTAALLAVAVAPSLAVALMQSFVTFLTVSVPLMSDSMPDVGRVMYANQAVGSVGGLVSLLAIPLGLLSMLGLRWALLEQASWRHAFGLAWQACRTNLVDVALMYLVFLAVSLVIGILVGIVLTVLVLIVAAIVVALAAAGSPTAALAVGVFAAVCLLVAFAAVQGAIALVFSVGYTVFWRTLTAPARLDAVPTTAFAAGGDAR